MELDIIKQQTTWNDAATSINLNFDKVKQAILLLQSAGGGSGGGLDEEALIEILKEYGYATEAYVATQISSILGGASSAYDTLKEIEDILEGNINSIDDILTAIATKAEKEDLAALELRIKAIEDAESEDMFAWADEEHTTIETEKNLVVKGDFSDAGVAGDVNIGVTSIVVDGVPYPDSDRDGVIDLTGAFENINVNLDNYYTKTEVYNKQEVYSKSEVNELVKGGESDMFAWADEAKTTIKTEKNLIVEGELSDSGVAGNVTVGISTIRIDSKDYTDTDRDGIIDLTDALKAFDFNLEDYATKAEVSVISTKVNSLVDWKEDFLKYIYVGDDGLVHVTTDIIIGGDIATAADGEGGGSYASIGIIVGNSLAEYPNTAGIVTLSKELITSGIGLGELAFTDNVSWDDVVGRPTSLSQFTDDAVSGKYLPLSGGTIKDSEGLPLVLNTRSSTSVRLRLQIQGSDRVLLGYNTTDGVFIGAPAVGYRLGITTDGSPIFYNGANNTLIHRGNIGSYKAGDSDKLGGISPEGYAKTGLINSAVSINYVGYGRPNEGNPMTGPMICFGINANYFAEIQGLMSADYLYYRRHTPEGFGATKIIAFTDSNVASATKLATARTIWGQSFDGTTNVTGSQYLPNQAMTAFYDTAGNAINVLHFSNTNNLHLGYGNRTKGYNTIVSGKDIFLYYGSGSQGFILNSSGNVTIGSTDLAGTSAKLYVNGNARSSEEFISTNSKGIGFRTVNGRYGVFFQNGGSNCYLLTTAQNDAYGTYNSLRPFAFNLSTGKVTLGEETTVSKLLTANGGVTIPTGKTLLLGSESLGATLQYITNVGVKIDGNLVVTGDLSDAGVADSGGGYFDIAIYPQYAYGDIYLAEIVLNGSDAYYLYMPSVTEYLGYTPFDEAEFTRDNIKSRLGISDWALAASKPSYTTNDVSEGANLYFTNARAKSAIFTGSSSQFLKADGTLDSTTYLGLNASGNLNISGVVFTNGIEFDQDVYISYLDDAIQMSNRYAGIYLYAGDMITLDGMGVDICSTADDMFISSAGTMDIRCDTDMAIYSYGVMEIGSESDMDVYAVGGLGLHSEGKASITSDMAITITGAHVSVGTQDRTASFLLQDGLMDVYCDLAIQGSLGLRHTGNYIGTGASNSMLFHSENNAIIFEVGEDQMVSITEDGLYVTSINDYKFDVETAVISGSSSLVTSGAVYSAIHGNLTPSANNTYNIGEDNVYYKYVIANNFFSGSVSNNLWLICGESSSSTAIVFARASTSTDSKVEMGRIDGYGITIEGDAIIKGDQATGSDIRFKNVIEDKVLDVKRIAEAPLFTFMWNDRNDDSIHLGSSAQYWEDVAPWLVSGEDFKTLKYATLGVAMGISLAKKTVNHEERIKELERKVESLETENRRLRYGN